MKIDPAAAVTLIALIRSDLQSIGRIETHVEQLDLDNAISRAELESLGYSLHNIHNALENSFKQISLVFESDPKPALRCMAKMSQNILVAQPSGAGGRSHSCWSAAKRDHEIVANEKRQTTQSAVNHC